MGTTTNMTATEAERAVRDGDGGDVVGQPLPVAMAGAIVLDPQPAWVALE